MGFGKRKSSARLSRSDETIKKRPSGQIDGYATRCRPAQDFRDLSQRILHYANRAVSVADFLREASKMILDFSGCDSVELRLKEGDSYSHCEAKRGAKQSFLYEHIPRVQKDDGVSSSGWQKDSGLERLCVYILNGRFDCPLPLLTKNGSFWTGNTSIPLNFGPEANGKEGSQGLSIGDHYGSLALIPLFVGNESIGLLQLKSRRRDYFTEDEIELYEDLAQNLGIAVVNQRVHAASHERVKELTCLYGIAQAAERPGISLEEILQRIVGLLSQAWQYPEIAFGKIILDGVSYSTPGFQDTRQKQSATITVNGKNRGVVEVVYADKKPKLDEGPFLKEERSLIDAVARQVALLIERKEVEEDKSNLQNQLRHADRLATIGQLAAGVAHELNEPLGNMLGFAQLAQKCPGLPRQAEKDIEQIVAASLRAREVIKKLLLTARQMPPRKTQVNLNQVVEDGLYLFEARCAKEGVEVVRLLSPNLPEITADPGQLNQVLVNLAVNSIQAMPEGGRLTVQTRARADHVSLIVEDTGVGMSEEVMKQIFIPFFTTKEVDQGTGLGLAVVHGIVTSHGGSIRVESQVDRGTRFEVQIPLTNSQEKTEYSQDGPFD
jgi:two-component system NtrC family sensor kinase